MNGTLHHYPPGTIFRETRRKNGELVYPASVCWRMERPGTPDVWGRCLCVFWRILHGWDLHPRGPSLRRFDQLATPTWELTAEHVPESPDVPEASEEEEEDDTLAPLHHSTLELA